MRFIFLFISQNTRLYIIQLLKYFPNCARGTSKKTEFPYSGILFEMFFLDTLQFFERILKNLTNDKTMQNSIPII